MKTNILLAARVLLFSLLTTIVYLNATSKAQPAMSGAPSALKFSISIPDAVQSQIERQDFENQTIFSFVNGDKNAYLFSVNKLTDEQWLSVKSNVNNYTILENKDGYITYIEKTDQTSIKGKNNTGYQEVLQQIDAMISSVKLQ
jgi:hypothetical protein